MTAAMISIANQALSRIAKGPIQSLAEGSVEADECALHLPQLLEEMAEWTEWPEAVRRTVLAQVTNDRPAEWLYAYRAPDDLSDPIHIRGVEDDATSLPEFSTRTLPLQNAYPLRFIVEDNTIYTNVETATLVYTTDTLDLNDLRPLQRKALITELASLLALSVKRDAKAAQFLGQQAEVARGRAIADAQNRNPTIQTRYVSEAELARQGLD